MAGGMSSGVAASDVIRSMMRVGFSHDEIYDVLTGTGLPGEQVQLLIDRVATEFNGAELEPRPSRLAAEVTKVFQGAIEELQHTMQTRVGSLEHQLRFLNTELEKLGRRIVRLELILAKAGALREEKQSNKSHKNK